MPALLRWRLFQSTNRNRAEVRVHAGDAMPNPLNRFEWSVQSDGDTLTLHLGHHPLAIGFDVDDDFDQFVGLNADRHGIAGSLVE